MEFRKWITVLAKRSVVMPVLVLVLAMLAAAPAETATFAGRAFVVGPSV